MTYNVFGGTLTLAQSMLRDVRLVQHIINLRSRVRKCYFQLLFKTCYYY